MITAKGLKNGEKLTVKYDGNMFLFNGKENDAMLLELESQLKLKPAIFGTYHAEDSYEKLNIIGVLRERFFDGWPEIVSDEEFDSEWEEGVVY